MPNIPAGAKTTDMTVPARMMGAGKTPSPWGRFTAAARYLITGVTPNTWMSPNQPVEPVAQEAFGRNRDYRVGYNLFWTPRGEELSSFAQLRALADNCDLVRLAIETRKDQLAALPWSVANLNPKADNGKDERVQTVEKMLKRPDGILGWSAWIRQLAEEMLVIDAATVLPRRLNNGSLYGFEIIDGAGIKPLVDDDGRTPQPPSPAYQQVLHGLPAVDYTQAELVYRPRNIRAHKFYGFSPVEQILVTVNIAIRRALSQLQYYCYSDDTEVLTKRGWQRFADCLPDDEFATRKIGDGAFEWQRAYDTFRKHYTGRMLHFKGRSLDLLVTPNHRMLVNSLPRGVTAQASVGGEHVISAYDMARRGTRNTGVPQTSVWAGHEIAEQVFIASGDRTRKSTPVRMSGDDFCAFMGMYLAEGSLHHKGGIAIAQPPDKRGAHNIYKALLKKIFGTGVCYSGHQFEVCRASLAQYLRQFGHAHEKFIPDEIREASPRQLAIFWRYYHLGDGNASGDHGEATQSVFTVSRQLADHLTEILQKMGRAPTVWVRHPRTGTIDGRPINSREGYVVTAARRQATKGWVAQAVDYDAPVACVCVPNKFLYVRRNGKACWSGNTEGNIPAMMATVPPEWQPAQIREFQEYWDSVIEGLQGVKRKVRFVPGGMKAENLTEPPLKDEFDEWLARIVCYAFSLPPTPFIKQNNRATAETQQESAEEEGLQPLKQWVKEYIDFLIQEHLGFGDLQFMWIEQEVTDPKAQSEVLLAYQKQGVYSVNEIRAKLGEDPITEDGGDEHLIITATGTVPLKQSDPTSAPVDPNADPNAPPSGKPDPGKPDDVAKRAPHSHKPDDTPLTPEMVKVKDAFVVALGEVRDGVMDEVNGVTKAAGGDGSRPDVPKKGDDWWLALADRIDLSGLSLAYDDYNDTVVAVTNDGARTEVARLVAADPSLEAAATGAGFDMLDHQDPNAIEWARVHVADMIGEDGQGGKLADATRDMIRQAITTALKNHDDDTAIAEMLQNAYAFSEQRAELIARTEVRDALGAGSWIGAKAVGMDEKRWLLSNDEGVCPLCEANAEQQWIPINQAFKSGAMYPLQHPNCRCDAAYRRKPKED